ncbi:MAG TPA: SGNH/GDSL hydrolase family protein [Terrimicrobiaceae bacterium]|nr:SGNH/GDSL hydrolase family protein [Terrimicrobiaceae bacterium]
MTDHPNAVATGTETPNPPHSFNSMHQISSILARPEPAKWVFYGDSITHGAFHTFGQRDYTEHFAERLRTELGRAQDIVMKTAISGNTTRALLETFDWRVASLQPDVVFVMIGMNDCSTGRDIPLAEFRSNLESVIRKIQALGAVPVLQTTCPILPNSAPDREGNFPQYMQAVRECAAALALPFVDHEEHWKAHSTQHYYWMSNAFHPNGAGHLAFAHELFRKLGIFDPASATCRLFVP